MRPQASDSPLYWKNYASAIKLCARYGGWSLSLTSSGEPTVDPRAVTKALEVYDECAKQGAYMPNVNLFTNGILIGDSKYCDEWLPKWKALGLTNICVSIHSVDRWRRGVAYGLQSGYGPAPGVPLELAYKYPAFETIFANIREHGIGVRTTLLLLMHEVVPGYQADVQRLINIFCMTVDRLCTHPQAKRDYKAVFIAAATGTNPWETLQRLNRKEANG